MARRQVRTSLYVRQQASHWFPPTASDGRPTYARFAAGPLDRAIDDFARLWDSLPEVIDGVGVKARTMAGVPAFPAMAFYAVLGDDGVVEIISLTVDEGYWDLIADDPDD